jgi:membrane glycosyltransferase
MRFARDPVVAVTPIAGRVRGDEPITASTAILVCIRNEPPERVIRGLAPMLEGLAAPDVGARFHLYVLSDTSEAAIAAAEDACFAALAQAWRGRIAVTYRRRTLNAGYKAGNIRDFCDRWGSQHDFALVLDADSVMTANAVLRLVRIMQVAPRLGILQSLVIGMPAMSAFARLFQFGMRLSMRSYTIGSAWWQGDCGPYWGHNAIVRLAPFMAHCELPTLSESALVSGHVLSHDQVEAVLMRRAGYEVRVLAEEGGSFEQNPPTLIEFIRRDLRWCQGNMQYWHFLVMGGLKPVSRYQLGFAILMFLGSPAWMGLLVLGTAAVAMARSPAAFIRPGAGMALFVTVLVMWFAPNIATAIDVLARPRLRSAFGGGLRFSLSAVAQTIFVLLLLPIMWFGHTLFLARLLLGRSVGWTAQARDDHKVPIGLAARQLWPQTLLGLCTMAVLGLTVPAAIPYALFLAGGLVLSIPFAVLTAAPRLGGDGAAGGARGARASRHRDQHRRRGAQPDLARAPAHGRRRAAIAAHLLFGSQAQRRHGLALWRIRQTGRPGLRCRGACGRPHRGLSQARRPRGRGRAATRGHPCAADAVWPRWRSRDRAAGRRPQRRNGRAEAQPRQSHRLHGVAGVRAGGRWRARLGGTGLDQEPPGSAHHAGRFDRSPRRAGLHQDRRRGLRGGGARRSHACGAGAFI